MTKSPREIVWMEGRFLSSGGKFMLINFVLLAIPTHLISFYELSS